ncbi:DUF4468 domain-containing protein [Pedobacter mucosus]|uniref:DUF4468 domain-containing protein n=1 Tax=Pedobacter mucosus TaxID=2895286 RepID=UPI001EE3C24A|nr:DUF4468 domain-containing protein [Pedobacter mucosus]UKT62482.1 DUF4468 domain-containing protein [Pedobacter mucosus]
MRYTFLFILAFLFTKLSAQQKQFPIDDIGKFIYYKVVDSQTVSKDSLIQRAKYFINVFNKNIFKPQSVTDSSILADGKTIIDKTILVAGHPSGEVRYHFVFEARQGKYRFWLTDFEYIPYQRDRYGNYVASTTIGTPLEKTPGKLSSNEWKDILSSCYTKTVKLGEDLEKFLATNRVEKPKKKTAIISTKKW